MPIRHKPETMIKPWLHQQSQDVAFKLYQKKDVAFKIRWIRTSPYNLILKSSKA